MVSAVAFSPDGRNILSGSSDGIVRVWNIKENTPVPQQSVGRPLANRLFRASYVPNSGLIAYVLLDGTINLRDAYTGAMAGKPSWARTDSFAADTLAVSGDGKWLVSESSIRTIQKWDIASGRALGDPMSRHTGSVNDVAVSPSNSLIAAASNDSTIRLWDVATRRLVKTLEGHEKDTVAFSVDGNYLFPGFYDSTVRIWDVQTGEAFMLWRYPDGQWIASGSADKAVRIWSLSTLSEVRVLKGHYNRVLSVASSFDSAFLLTGEAVGGPLRDHTDWTYSIVFSPNGDEFASGSGDGTIPGRIWDTWAHIDLGSQGTSEADYSELSEEELRIRWSHSQASVVENDGWV